MGITGSTVRVSVARWGLLYLAVGLIVAFVQSDNGQTAWYPAIAVGVALLLLHGLRWWPVVLAVELVVSGAQHWQLTGGLVSAIVTTGEIVAMVWLLHRFRFRTTFERVDDVVLMGAIATAVAMAGSALGNLALHLTNSSHWSYTDGWKIWTVGDLTGTVLVLPTLLLLSHRQPTTPGAPVLPRSSRLEAQVVSLLTAGVLAGYFATVRVHELTIVNAGPLTLCLMPIIWIAVRFGLARTAALIVALDGVAVVAYVGIGPHLSTITIDSPDSLDLVTLQLPILAVGLAALGVAAAIEAVQRAVGLERVLIDASPVAIVALDEDGIVQSWNAAAEQIFGYSAAEAIGHTPPMVANAQELDEQRNRFVSGEVTIVQYRHKNGSVVTGRLFGSSVVGADGKWGRVGIIEDISKEVAAIERQALLNTAFDQAGEAIIITTPEPAIIYANPAALNSSGWSLAEVLGENPRIFKSGQQGPELYAQLWQTLMNGERWEGILVNRRKSGDLYEERCTIGPVFSAQGKLIAYVAVKHDLSRERLLEADLERSVQIRGTALQAMEHIERQATAHDTAHAFCERIAQVTGTEVVVATFRHNGSITALAHHGATVSGIADVAIPQEMAEIYLRVTNEGSWASSPISPRVPTSPWTAHFIAHQVSGTLQAAIRSEGRLVGALILITRAPNGATWMADHLDLADELGSFASVLLGSQIDAELEREVSKDRIAGVIERHEFHPVFQPFVSLETGEVGGYEALTRFDDGTRPDLMITEAWNVGLGLEMEEACAREAIVMAQRMLPGMSISLNFSPETVLSGRAALVVASADFQVVVEVTEHTAITDYPALRAALEGCGKIKVSVDDAGAGFASMRHILELHPDVVKLDIALIRDIDTDLGRQALAAGLCHYAAETGTVLIAEGVETQAEADMVRRLGVQHGQGYHFGKPARIG